MPGSTTKPRDICVAAWARRFYVMIGKSVAVDNTDTEGRLVLAVPTHRRHPTAPARPAFTPHMRSPRLSLASASSRMQYVPGSHTLIGWMTGKHKPTFTMKQFSRGVVATELLTQYKSDKEAFLRAYPEAEKATGWRSMVLIDGTFLQEAGNCNERFGGGTQRPHDDVVPCVRSSIAMQVRDGIEDALGRVHKVVWWVRRHGGRSSAGWRAREKRRTAQHVATHGRAPRPKGEPQGSNHGTCEKCDAKGNFFGISGVISVPTHNIIASASSAFTSDSRCSVFGVCNRRTAEAPDDYIVRDATGFYAMKDY
ncbi:hypothetical protein GGX14DRAFT_403927 [Mycena pura]|uniref:Uncharacterized protein n=1 Tax=Mycena pura TaxID=153505 RepID=A0AAD6UVM7_9AGAR|nr:hypothetical protein GGX14DRAFT_403927 [Mycena pura]